MIADHWADGVGRQGQRRDVEARFLFGLAARLALAFDDKCRFTLQYETDTLLKFKEVSETEMYRRAFQSRLLKSF
jgi:hypothetical protein